MPIIEPRFRAPFLALFCVFALFGTSITIIGATLPRILADFQWDYLVAGLVIGAGSVAYFVSTFAAGHLVKRYGPKRTIVLGLLLAVTGLAFFAANADPLANILLYALIGLGQGCIEVGVNCATLSIDPHNTGRPMNLMHGAFAVGAIAGPLALGALLRGGLSWIVIYRAIALICALLAALVVFTALPAPSTPAGTHADAHQRLGANPAYWLSFVALFVYVGVEVGVSNWIAEYFVAVFAYPPDASALLVSLFWAGLLAGRFGVPLLYHGPRQDVAMLALSLLATVAIGALAALGHVEANAGLVDTGRVLVFLAGLGCSIYYPVIITLLGKCFPHAQSQAIGFAATGGGIGMFVFPFVMSACAQAWGIRAGFATYGVFAAMMTAAAVGLAVAAARHAAAASATAR